MVTSSSNLIALIAKDSLMLIFKFYKGHSKFLDVCDQSAVFVAQVSYQHSLCL